MKTKEQRKADFLLDLSALLKKHNASVYADVGLSGVPVTYVSLYPTPEIGNINGSPVNLVTRQHSFTL